MQTKKVAMVAGEASGDLLAGLLLDGLQSDAQPLKSYGIGGPQMAQRGFEAWWPHHKLAVHGFSLELLRRYREIVGIRAALQQRLLQQRPDVFIGVDAPDFNLQLEANLRAQGIKTVHFVCPSVWAWRAERLETIRRSVDHVLCIFPFEPALLAAHGIDATYVGHPLAQMIPLQPDRAAARALLGLPVHDEVVALLPGSRSSEIRHLAARFFQAATIIHANRPATRFVLPALPGLQAEIEAIAAKQGVHDLVQIVSGQSHTVLAACDVTLIASGTATLEAALFKRPMVIAYHMAWLSWQLMRRKRLQPWVGLPNILCQDFVVSELLQEAATPHALAQAVLQWLDAAQTDPARLTHLQQRFTEMHLSLQRDTAQLASHAIETVLQS
jgi:lipid-A-disaccharide synthase